MNGTEAAKSQFEIEGYSGLWLAIWRDGRRGYLVTTNSKRPWCLAFFEGISKEALGQAIIASQTEPEFIECKEKIIAGEEAAWFDFVGAVLYPLDAEGLRTEQRACYFTWDGCFMMNAGQTANAMYERADMKADLKARGIALAYTGDWWGGFRKPAKAARGKAKAKRVSRKAATAAA